MKVTIQTKTAGEITINSDFKGDKQWKNSNSKQKNWNNHLITVTHNKKRLSFDFWGSIMNPENKTEQEVVFAFYCLLSDSCAGNETFENFCGDFGYDQDSRTAERIHKQCISSLAKFNRVFDCDLYELCNEIQETWEC